MIAVHKLKQGQRLMGPVSRKLWVSLEHQLNFPTIGRQKVLANAYSTGPSTGNCTGSSNRRSAGSSNAIQDSYKQCMSKVASQAMIVTCGIPMKKKEKAQADTDEPILRNLHGSTVSSVSSLSVSPRTLISLNLQIPSATSECSHKHGWIAIHLLPSNSENSVRLIREFSKGSKYLKNKNDESTTKRDLGGEQHVSVMEKEDKVTLPFNWLRHEDFVFSSEIYKQNKEQQKGETIAQRFHSVLGAQSMEQMMEKGIEIPILSGAERVLICEKDQVFRVDDHEIWVCEVKDVLVSHSHDTSSTGGVLFYNRGFHGLGEPIKKDESQPAKLSAKLSAKSASEAA